MEGLPEGEAGVGFLGIFGITGGMVAGSFLAGFLAMVDKSYRVTDVPCTLHLFVRVGAVLYVPEVDRVVLDLLVGHLDVLLVQSGVEVANAKGAQVGLGASLIGPHVV